MSIYWSFRGEKWLYTDLSGGKTSICSFFPGGKMSRGKNEYVTPVKINCICSLCEIWQKSSYKAHIYKIHDSKSRTNKLYIFCPNTYIVNLCVTYLRDRPFNLKGGGGGLWFFDSFRKKISDNTRVRIFIFLLRKARIFFPEFHIRLYDKNSESNFFFPPPKSEYFF